VRNQSLGRFRRSGRALDASVVLWLIFVHRLALLVGAAFQGISPAEDVRREERPGSTRCMRSPNGFAMVDVLLDACMEGKHFTWRLAQETSSVHSRGHARDGCKMARPGGGGAERKRARVVARLARVLVARAGESGRRSLRPASRRSFSSGVDGEAWEMQAPTRRTRGARQSSRKAMLVAISGHVFAVKPLYYLGDIKELERRLSRMVADARDRGDLKYDGPTCRDPRRSPVIARRRDSRGGPRQVVDEAQWVAEALFSPALAGMALIRTSISTRLTGQARTDPLMRDMPAVEEELLLSVQFGRGMKSTRAGAAL